MGITWSQFFPPSPTLTEANLPSQKGKVFIVTGGYSGVGFELCKFLYQAGGKVYLAGRSQQKATDAIKLIKDSKPSSGGEIIFLSLHLDDLVTIKPAVQKFTAAESRLDVLFNNAGVSNPPRGSLSTQGHELQLATNCLGPHILTQLLLPILKRTAQDAPSASVRVIWLSSIVTDVGAPKHGLGAKELQELLSRDTSPQRNYQHSKVGNWFLADALAKEVGSDGVLSVVVNPGNLKSGLTRHLPKLVPVVFGPLLYHTKFGAYTELWAGLSSDLKITDGGKYIIPWGRLHSKPREDILEAMKTKEEGGTGDAATFVHYCDDQIANFK